MEREKYFFFSPSSSTGQAANLAVLCIGPFAVCFLSFFLLWQMFHSSLPASYLFPLYGALQILLFLVAGPSWAFVLGCFTTLVGEVGFLFSHTPTEKLLFLSGTAFVWIIFYLMTKMALRWRATLSRIDEEFDRLDRDLSVLTADNDQLRNAITDCQDRIPAYHQLQKFTDDLIGAFSINELTQRARKGLTGLFSRASVDFMLFPKPNVPAKDDIWGRRSLTFTQPRLFHSVKIPIASSRAGRAMVIPVKSNEDLTGRVLIQAKPGANRFETVDLRLAAVAVDLVSLAMGNAELYSKTEALATSDSLSGLYTKTYFFERLQEELAKARHRGLPLSLLIVDIDHFKSINDYHGHRIGDEVIRWLSRHITTQAREADIVARYGGDEIVALMPHTKASEATDFATRLCHSISRSTFRWGETQIRLTISGGVASLDEAIQKETDLLERADQALYVAKQKGRNQIVAA